MKFLIPTEPDDVHAVLVKLALEKLNHQVTLMFTADQPTRQKNSVYIDVDRYHWKSTDTYDAIFDGDYDLVWWRRPRTPHVPEEAFHSDDYQFAIRENRLFYESFTHNLAPNARWINSKEAAHRANFKLLQLKIASEVGLTIPTTLCSNDPYEIRAFVSRYQDNGIIYKPLCTNFWFESQAVRVAYTTRVSELDLPSNQSLQRLPSLFQKEMKKKYELRIHCFGERVIAVKLDSQRHSMGKTDWRLIPPEQLNVQLYQLSDDIEDKIRCFMREIGIVFGVFDFVVTDENEYIFLEVNEQGQFLWIEELNPSIHLLDAFVHFITSSSSSESVGDHVQDVVHTISDYQQDADFILEKNMREHVCLNQRLI